MSYLGTNITFLRKEKGITQLELGEKLNITAQAISKWEKDQAEPDIAMLKKIAEIFDVSLDELTSQDVKSVTRRKETEAAVSALPQAPAQELVVGHCTRCGVNVYKNNLGEHLPKVICKSCVQTNKKNTDKLIESFSLKILQFKQRHFKSLILKCIFSAIIMVVLGLVFNEKSVNGFVKFLSLMANMYILFALSYELMTSDSVARDCLYKFSWLVFKMPGVIFELSFDGIIFLLAVKLAMWLLTIFLALVAFILGLLTAAITAPFTFPFTITKHIAMLRCIK